MKKAEKNPDYLRIENLIEKDRLSVGSEFSSLFKHDLSKLFGEYAEIKEPLNVKLVRDGKDFIITVTAKAQRLKNFIVVKKDGAF